jgi:hypothetical protein
MNMYTKENYRFSSTLEPAKRHGWASAAHQLSLGEEEEWGILTGAKNRAARVHALVQRQRLSRCADRVMQSRRRDAVHRLRETAARGVELSQRR